MSVRTTRSSGGSKEFEMAKSKKNGEISRTAFEKLKKEKNSAIKAMDEANNKLQVSEQEKANLIEDLDTQKKNHEHNYEKLQRKYNKMKTKHQDQHQQLLADLNEQEVKQADAEKEYAALMTKVNELESQIKNMENENGELLNKLKEAKKEKNALDAVVENLTDKNERLYNSKKIVEGKKKTLLRNFLSYKDRVLASQLRMEDHYAPRSQSRQYDSDDDYSSNVKHHDYKRSNKPYSRPYSKHRSY